MDQHVFADDEDGALERAMSERTRRNAEVRPHFYCLENESDRRSLRELLRDGLVTSVIDEFEDQEREYFQILHPEWANQPDFHTRFTAYQTLLDEKTPPSRRGRWVFFPWLAALVHILDHEEFFAVRTARNRGLITGDEQRRFYDAAIGIAGLSVGNSVALAIVLSGGARYIRLADFDTMALSNTNRVRAGVESLGLKKVVITARQIYTLNPYAQVDIFDVGLTEENVEGFIAGPPALDVMIDEFDDLLIKTKLRQYARQFRVPVVTGYDIADTGVLDIERYDLDPETPFFHGGMGDLTYDQLRSLDRMGSGFLLARHVGPENASQRMQEAFSAVGKTLVSWPQLGGTALLNGSAVAFCVRRIVNNQPIESKRALVSLDEKLIPNFGSAAEQAKRDEATARFRKQFGL